ncbi:MAG: Flp pilus assembly protein CpaB [Planctomycetaceae bacterium]|nr:Flp pilus assembly protein CpaB [Planctomycetaceae bacterium]
MRRLSPAMLTMLMLGAIGLLVAMYFGKKLLFAKVEVPQERIENVPMALSDLKAGTKITDAHIATGRSLASKLTRDTVRTSRIVVGRVVKNDIKAAEPISTFDLYPAGEGPPPEVSPGMRAITLNLPAPMVRPGGYVDIHFTPSQMPDQALTGGTTLTLLKGVKVLEVDGNRNSGLSTNGDNARVSLEVSVEQANILLLVKDKGELNLIYTPDGAGDGLVSLSDEDRATLDEILGLKKPDREEEAKPFVTEVYSGAGRRLQQFRDGKRADLYAIERHDYFLRNQSATQGIWGGNGYGGYGGFGYGTVGDRPAPLSNYGGYYSVPSNGGGASGPAGGPGMDLGGDGN